ncbi:MAG: hypothetical protein JXB43_02555 [Dehalococcoidia bacterium]|nr:hypothetical protein [Dehalococcoidia bacterium]
MKRLLILLAAVVLLAGLGGGYTYAQTTHQPMAGQKLVGWGPAGVTLGADPSIYATLFMLTNPDCLGEIKVASVSVFKDDGTVIYEGPPIAGGPGEVLKELADPLQPHESANIFLPLYVIAYEMGVDPLYFNEHQPPDITEWPNSAYYSIEIFWNGAKNGLPLTGWMWLGSIVQDSEGNYSSISALAMSQMVNMTQVLTKSK